MRSAGRAVAFSPSYRNIPTTMLAVGERFVKRESRVALVSLNSTTRISNLGHVISPRANDPLFCSKSSSCSKSTAFATFQRYSHSQALDRRRWPNIDCNLSYTLHSPCNG